MEGNSLKKQSDGEQRHSPEEPRLSERYAAFLEKVKGKLSPEETEEFSALNEEEKGKESREDMSATDYLTGLRNRRGFYEEVQRLDALLAREQQYTRMKIPSAFLYIDLDGFKEVNDSCGHACGDRGLKLVAENVRAAVREYDVLARIGGDEFGVFTHGNDEEAAVQFAGRIRAAIEGVTEKLRAEYPGYKGHLSASIGVIGLDEAKGFLGEKFTPEEAMRLADFALYAAKAAGKEGTLSYTEAAKLDSDGTFKKDFLASA